VTYFAQALLDGLSAGATYALIAIAFSLVWATVRTVNLALLQVLSCAGMLAYLGAQHGVVLAFVYGLLGAVVIGVASHFVAIVPTLSKGQIYPIITSLGFGLLLTAGLVAIFGDLLRPVPPVLPEGGARLGGTYLSWGAVLQIAVALVLVVAAIVVMRSSRVGLAFRSSAWAPDLAGAYGVNLPAVRLGSAVVSSLLIGLAGVFIALTAGSVGPLLGATAGLKGMVAMLIGGAGNLPGAVVGGLAVGLVESVSLQYTTSALSGAIAFAVLFALMVLKPSGLMKEY